MYNGGVFCILLGSPVYTQNTKYKIPHYETGLPNKIQNTPPSYRTTGLPYKTQNTRPTQYNNIIQDCLTKYIVQIPVHHHKCILKEIYLSFMKYILPPTTIHYYSTNTKYMSDEICSI